jgi:hypothetical protein
VSKSAVLESLTNDWIQFLGAAEGVSDQKLMLAGAIGDWSVYQCLIHVASWDEEVIRIVSEFIDSGTRKPPGVPHDLNNKQLEQKKDLDSDTTWQYLRDSHTTFLSYVQGLPEEMFDMESYTGECIGITVPNHYKGHQEEIERFTARS